MSDVHAEPASPRSLTLTVPQAARALGISETLAYQQARGDGWLVPAVVRIGGRIVISRVRMEQLINGQPSPEKRAA